MLTMMLVDDSMTLQLALGRVLARSGFTVISAMNGEEALQKLQTDASPDIVVTDLNMPRLDGLSLVREIRRHPKHRAVPILMMTTESQRGRLEEGRQAGVSGWLVKPVRPPELILAVQKLLQRAG